jgi:hypothetical protein
MPAEYSRDAPCMPRRQHVLIINGNNNHTPCLQNILAWIGWLLYIHVNGPGTRKDMNFGSPDLVQIQNHTKKKQNEKKS